MRIELRTNNFDPYKEVSQYQGKLQPGEYGASAVFVGSLRDFNEGETVERMYLEHYPGMTEKHLHKICAQAQKQWTIIDGLVLHRTGDIKISDAIVLVAIWSAHRGDALDACRFIMEDLKHKAPFWKKEQLPDGERWVEKNTSGYGH